MGRFQSVPMHIGRQFLQFSKQVAEKYIEGKAFGILALPETLYQGSCFLHASFMRPRTPSKKRVQVLLTNGRLRGVRGDFLGNIKGYFSNIYLFARSCITRR